MLALAGRQQASGLRQLLPAACQAAQLQQERGMKLFEVRRGRWIARAAWVLWEGALELAAAARERAACCSTAMPVSHNIAVHISIGLQIFSKEEREKRKAKLKVRRVPQGTLHSAVDAP